jgi:hypothetical protein
VRIVPESRTLWPAGAASPAGTPLGLLPRLLTLVRRENLRDSQLELDASGKHGGLSLGDPGAQLLDLRAVRRVGKDRRPERSLQFDELARGRLRIGLGASFVGERPDLLALRVGQVQLAEDWQRAARSASSNARSWPVASRRLTGACGNGSAGHGDSRRGDRR